MRLCADTLQKKTKEYTGDDTDRLGAFKSAAALQHATPQRALAGMMAKHIISIYDMCFTDRKTFELAVWEEKITDSLNYLFLLHRSTGSRKKHGVCGKTYPAGSCDSFHG